MKNEKKSTPYFPMFVDLSGKSIVVIGGGNIATRRVKALLPFGPEILVVANKLTEDLKLMKKEHLITCWKRKFSMEDFSQQELKECDIMIAATNDHELNTMIANRCRISNITVNVVDNRKLCDFYFPGIVHQNHVVVGVTASGEDHRGVRDLKRFIQQGMRQLFPNEE